MSLRIDLCMSWCVQKAPSEIKHLRNNLNIRKYVSISENIDLTIFLKSQ